MGSLITGFTNKRSTFGRFIHKWNIYPETIPWKLKFCYSENQNFLRNKCLIFFFTSNDKDEFNTILKHLIKLVKNFKTHCYVIFFFFSNISHLATFFIHLYKWCRRVGDRGGAWSAGPGEGTKGEVLTFDLYSSVTSWGQVERARLSQSENPEEPLGEHEACAVSELLSHWRGARPVNTISTQSF